MHIQRELQYDCSKLNRHRSRPKPREPDVWVDSGGLAIHNAPGFEHCAVERKRYRGVFVRAYRDQSTRVDVVAVVKRHVCACCFLNYNNIKNFWLNEAVQHFEPKRTLVYKKTS